jgi:hypothetical protein
VRGLAVLKGTVGPNSLRGPCNPMINTCHAPIAGATSPPRGGPAPTNAIRVSGRGESFSHQVDFLSKLTATPRLP